VPDKPPTATIAPATTLEVHEQEDEVVEGVDEVLVEPDGIEQYRRILWRHGW
jgi:hypothetical protein